MSDNKVKIQQDMFDEPLRVKPDGIRTAFAILLLVIIAMNTCSTEMQTRETKELTKKKLELAKKHYQLDSLRFEHVKQQQK